MKGTRIASRYAKSLLNLALDQGELDRAYSDMKLVASTCDTSKDLELLLKSPIVKADKKIIILEKIFSGQISDLSHSFIKIITNKGRENHLPGIAEEFQRQYKSQKKIVTAEVSSATGLDDELREQVLKIVKDSLKSEVELVEKENKNLIGGLIITVGDKQFDASIQNKLNELKRTFSEPHYTKN